MKILDITNRTENWKTAQTFSKFIANGNLADFANKIISNAEKTESVIMDKDVCLELFWKGFRDYRHEKMKEDKFNDENFMNKVVEVYNKKFSNLQEEIKKAGTRLNINNENNYIVPEDQTQKKSLYANLINTEIDIVISTSNYLLIGEAKLEESFGADSDHILTHQLVREYVMATIITEFTGNPKTKIIPFVISKKSVENCGQVKVMKKIGRLVDGNLMKWDQII